MTNLVPEDWNSTVTKILNHKYYAYASPEVTLGQKQHIEKHILMWKIALIWMFKIEEEIEGKLKLPFPHKMVQLLEPHGKHLHCFYILCKECHVKQFLLGYDLPYKHGFEWLYLIYKELIYEGRADVFSSQTQSPSKFQPSNNRKSLVRNGEIKRRQLRALNDSCTMVANHENPFRNNKKLHNLSSLLDTAIKLAEISKSFDNRYFKPYIKSWREMLRSMESSEFTRHWVENGELYCRSGLDRRVRNITKENKPRIPLRSKGPKTFQQLLENL